MKFHKYAAISLAVFAATPAYAEWRSVDDKSRVAFGSVKSDAVGEVHHFNKVSGTVSETGELKIGIDLASVDTNIDIRNERMTEHVFQKGTATASVTGSIDMAEVNKLEPGDSMVAEVQVSLEFAGSQNDLDAELLVARLAENRVLVTTADFIMISTEDLGIDEGVDQLMQLANLPGITRVTPVAIRMVFEK